MASSRIRPIFFTPAQAAAALAIPVPPRTGMAAQKALSKAARQIQGQAVWDAIARDDEAGLTALLADGAPPNHRLSGKTPLYDAVSRGRWALADVLLRFKADPNAHTLAGHPVWHAIALRNDPAEADRLLAAGVLLDGKVPEGWLTHRADRLLAWWLEKNPEVCLPADDWREWCDSALRGGSALRHRLNALWKVSATDPLGCAQAWPAARNADCLAVFTQNWGILLRSDDTEQIRDLIADGWASPVDGFGKPWAFVLLDHGALRTLAWWLTVPAHRQEFLAQGEQIPEVWWDWACVNVPRLEQARALGLDVSRPFNGTSLAHRIFAGAVQDPTKAMVTWWTTHAPDALLWKGRNGKTPIDEVKIPAIRHVLDAWCAGRLRQRLGRALPVAPVSAKPRL